MLPPPSRLFPTTSSALKRRGSWQRQSAQLSARHALGDRFAGRDGSYSDAVYEKAREKLPGAARRAPLVEEDEPALYFYRLRMGGHEQTGVAACFSVDEYEQDVIKKHERTRPDKEDDRTRHIIELARADRRRFPDLPGLGGRRSALPRDHRRRASLRLPGRRRRAPHDLAGEREEATAAGGRLRADSGAVHCRRAPSRGERGAGAREGAGRRIPAKRTRSSPWRSRRTRCTSCPTTAR